MRQTEKHRACKSSEVSDKRLSSSEGYKFVLFWLMIFFHSVSADTHLILTAGAKSCLCDQYRQTGGGGGTERGRKLNFCLQILRSCLVCLDYREKSSIVFLLFVCSDFHFGLFEYFVSIINILYVSGCLWFTSFLLMSPYPPHCVSLICPFSCFVLLFFLFSYFTFISSYITVYFIFFALTYVSITMS